MKKALNIFLLLYLLTIFKTPVFAQDSSHLRISLLTCTPGDELYSTFGHSALRIIDSSQRTETGNFSDIVYNYGTFNFDDEGFYIKFIRGKLLYYISRAYFEEFSYEYKESNRGITEQVLNLSPKEKTNILRLLNENLKEINRFYKYDFFLDNCTTRLRDIIVTSKHPAPLLPAVMPLNTSFRNAIHLYLDNNRQYWSKLGIDILLGSPTDAVMTTAQQQFLPDNLMTALNNTRNVKVVSASGSLFKLPQPLNNFTWFRPSVFFVVLLSLFLALGLSTNKRAKIILSGLDGFLFFMTGLLGMLLIFMMTATDHSMTKSNYNILWAWPTHSVISFFINSNRNFVKRYFLVTATGLVILLFSWFFLPQQMSPALLPFVLLLLYRSVSRYLY